MCHKFGFSNMLVPSDALSSVRLPVNVLSHDRIAWIHVAEVKINFCCSLLYLQFAKLI